ncbi:transcriptional regulator FeaR [Zestomonas carbonaria]|uniref:Transcriptional activator FeaR n=1 Tax=Zestomonas carbonaria TaxID=2762745 RepID=A0A7U7EKX2_9GAMM|nr:transcriptional regulator FeaR [Pseudomonas carbonaria]CAD5106894.1 Transcriptional activator FeaR [Pseudomonas carbonaria]
MTVQTLHDFDHWNHAVQAVCGRFVTQRAWHSDAFVGDIQHRDVGGLNFADISTNAIAISRERGNPARADDRYYFLVMQRQGVMAINHGIQQFVLQPGDIALLDSVQAFEMRPQGLIKQLSIHLCRDAVDRLLPASARRFGKLEQESPTGRLLRGMLQQIATGDMSPAADSQHGAALQDALIALLQPSLNDEQLPEVGRPLRRLAEKLINESLPEAPTPTELAARLNVSVRKLYRQFEIDGDSICRYIQRQRLERSARELEDTSGNALPITTIAYKWGFTDSAHFSRVFKQHYGLSPKTYRAEALRGQARSAASGR